MPFFSFRRGNPTQPAGQAAAPESADALRRRAKHRLIGSAVLVLAAVIGFPLLFDTQPRPVAVDIPIDIPGRATVKPLAVPPVASAPAAAKPPAPVPAPQAAASRAGGEKVALDASLTPDEEVITSKPAPALVNAAASAPKSEAKKQLPPAEKPVDKSVAKSVDKPVVKPIAQPEPKPEPKQSPTDEAARARALLNGTTPPAPTKPTAPATPAATTSDSAERFIVQVGAFGEVLKAREARLKVEGAGLKTYTQVVEGADGRRIRVRVGPFATRADADKAAARIKSLGLPAAILTL